MNEQERLTTSVFGTLPDGRSVYRFVLTSPYGIEVALCNWGATVLQIQMPDCNQDVGDVVLGYDTLEGYMQDPFYLGATIGRVAGRIKDARYWKNGKRYQLGRNAGLHHLHGGEKGWSRVLWDAYPFETNHSSGVVFCHTCKDGTEGYPGNVTASVRYTLCGKTLQIHYEATTDQETPLNLTNHTYFNLKDGGATGIESHKLFIRAAYYLPMSEAYVPQGSFDPVYNTPFDFMKPRKLAKKMDVPNPQLQQAGGLDHCFVLEEESYTPCLAATLREKSSGRSLDVFTTYPAVQCYSGNFLDGSQKGRGAIPYIRRAGICLETQYFPDSPNQPHFPSIFLLPGEVYQQQTLWRFSWGA